MSSDYPSREEELRRREEAIKAREIQIRMRELEAELDPTPVHPTTKHKTTSKQKSQLWHKRIPNIVKFFLFVIAVVVALRIAAWLTTAVLVLSIAWVGYKVFLESNPNQ
ncbi:MAG: hypothetical protein AAFX01_03300 [Cyanobacteria bacterium J06638_28]